MFSLRIIYVLLRASCSYNVPHDTEICILLINSRATSYQDTSWNAQSSTRQSAATPHNEIFLQWQKYITAGIYPGFSLVRMYAWQRRR